MNVDLKKLLATVIILIAITLGIYLILILLGFTPDPQTIFIGFLIGLIIGLVPIAIAKKSGSG